MKRRNDGFTLIELMIVVAIIGILASLAVSAYQTYTVRAQISEGLTFASGAKVPIVDAYTQDGTAPADRVAAGMSPNPIDSAGGYVSAVDINAGTIVVTFGGTKAHQVIVGKTLTLTPYETAGNTVLWRCGYAPPTAGSVLLNGAGYIAPTVDQRYLPSVCRP